MEPLHLFCLPLSLFPSIRKEDGSPITTVGDDEWGEKMDGRLLMSGMTEGGEAKAKNLGAG